ncbi:hypothetical protein IKG07_00970 [Candidatus Saccharibacteria bacterium]|nr:hypothetical protein [Candidatus Saccharibacteria bacterium]
MRDTTKNKKALIISIAVALVFSLIVGIILFINSQMPHFPDVDEGPGEEIFERSLVFYNRDILTLAYSEDFSLVALDNIRDVVFSEEEMKYSQNNTPLEDDSVIYYDATIDASNFVFYDTYTSEFNIKISDEREYKVVLSTDSLIEGFTYAYVGISRNGDDKIFVFLNGDPRDQDTFIEFAKEKIGKNSVKVTSVELSTEE